MPFFRGPRGIVAVVLTCLATCGGALRAAADDPRPVLPVAVFPFQERGPEVEDLGAKVSDLLLAQLLKQDDLHVVERQDLDKVLQELGLSASGLADPARAASVGRISGAKVLVTGSVVQVGDSLYLVAKLVGVETTRVVGASAKGKAKADLDLLVEELARDVVAKLTKRAGDLAPPATPRTDRVAQLAKTLGDAKRPSIWIEIQERHVGQPTIDPAAETELAAICSQLGFVVLDRAKAAKSDADVILQGEGFSQFAAKHGPLVSVKARLELKAIDRRESRVLAADRQTTVVADSAELSAAKSALQEAAAELASRMLPKLTSRR